MKFSTAVFIATCVVAATISVQGTTMSQAGSRSDGASMLEVLRPGSQSGQQGSPDNFTGRVTIESRFVREDPSRIGGARVTFRPGARTAWHTHPLGQTLVVTTGTGWVQREGGPKQEIHAGDIIWTPPGVKHWHGATVDSTMSHVAIVEAREGSQANWLEQVSERTYRQ
jgi:4-carboxymuconolactone decarboxylase